MREHVAGEIGGDHDLGAEGARGRHRHRIDQRAVDQPAVADEHRLEDSGQRIGGAHRIDHRSMRQPDLVTGADFGRDGRELDRQILDQVRPDRSFELGGELGAADQAGAVEADVEIAEDVAGLQRARPFLQPVEMPGRIGAADHRADGGADHDIGHDAVGDQRLQDADMGKAARGAAAQRESDDRLADTAKADLAVVIDCPWANAVQEVQHLKLLDPSRAEGPLQTMRGGVDPPEASRTMVYAATWQPLRRGL